MISIKTVSEGLAHVFFDTGKINVFSSEDIRQLDALLTELEHGFSKDCRAVVFQTQKISPSGHAIFCAGADQRERVDWGCDKILAHLAYQRAVVHRLRRSPLWSIVCVDGLALGLGVELCLAADFVLASERAKFGFPEKDWGIIPGAGGTAWAHGWAKDKIAAQLMISSGEKFDVEKAQWLGIVDVCAESEDFSLYFQEIMDWLKGMSLEAQIERKKTRYADIDFESWFAFEQAHYASALKLKRENKVPLNELKA